jgi:hypothetical protein
MSSRPYRVSVAAALLCARIAAAQAPSPPPAPEAPAPEAPAPAAPAAAAPAPAAPTPAAPAPAAPAPAAPAPAAPAPAAPAPVAGTQDGGVDAMSRERDPGEDTIELGVLAVLRIDGKGRGFAGGAGLAISRGNYEVELMLLGSDVIGGYLGGRYQVFTGSFRPYVAAGAPGFVFDHDELQPDNTMMTTRRLSIGVRAAAGIELWINDHLSVQADLGYEHFFFLDDTDPYETDVFVPTLGVIGRL